MSRRRGSGGDGRRRRVAALLALGLALGLLTAAGGTAGAATGKVRPNGLGMLDCNGLSSAQQPAKMGLPCAHPRGLGGESRFEDNGHYIGHDEPAIRFVSSRPGSSANITWTEKLPVDPAALPTVKTPGHDVTHYFELSVAPWFSTTLCDPNSFPLTPCRPRSDANAPRGLFPGGGAAFMELQFYAPGFAPFDDSISCDNAHWCSALTIDSLACAANGACNNDCVEPVNFAFIQTNGVPAGPPSPQLSNLRTFTPNARTLRMNPGDTVRIHMFDAPVRGGHALEIVEHDLTTGQRGFMIASGANGFMSTSFSDCSGTPFDFEPAYSSAKPENLLPWGIGPYNVNTQEEIGHFEPCTKLTGPVTFTDGPFTDRFFRNCIGPYESKADAGSDLEPSDAPCYFRGDTHGGAAPPNLVTGCAVFFEAIGDLDFDGTSYRADWPNSLTPNRFPSPFLQQQPTSLGARYSRIQFESTISATEAACDTVSGNGCTMPPPGPGHFYPYWTLARVGGRCVWEFGNMRNGNTFGRFNQYGAVGPHTVGGFVSAVRPNPSC